MDILEVVWSMEMYVQLVGSLLLGVTAVVALCVLRDGDGKSTRTDSWSYGIEVAFTGQEAEMIPSFNITICH